MSAPETASPASPTLTIDDQSEPGAWATHIAHTPHLSQSVESPDDTRQWSWWAGRGSDPESFTLNEASRDAIIHAGRDEFDGELFTIVCATQDGPFDTAPFDSERLVEHVVDRFAEDNSSRFGEEGFDGDIDLCALAAALNAAFAAFMDQHGQAVRVWVFTGQRDREEVRP